MGTAGEDGYRFPDRRYCWLAGLATPLLMAPGWWVAAQWRGGRPTFQELLLAVLLVVAAATDWVWHKIPNWATYPAILWALGIEFAAAVARWLGANELVPAHVGSVGLGDGFAGGLVCFTLMLCAYRIAGGGAGDVKLATAIGCLLGVRRGVHAVFAAYLAAGVTAVCIAIWLLGPWALAGHLGRTVGRVLWPGHTKPPDETRRRLLSRPMPLGVFFLIGTSAVVFGEGGNWLD
jgi:Flp pilus assembly protein protease CpaA